MSRAIAVTVAAVLASLVSVGPVAQKPESATTRLIVRADSDAACAADHAVVAAGGSVISRIGIINAVVAEVPVHAVISVVTTRGVAAVTPDARVQLAGQVDGYDPNWTTPTGSWKRVLETIKAKDAWKAGFLGQGVDVALIDSGVSPVEGISDHLLYGPDLSFESPVDSLRNLDSYGHGSHMAGIIAGRDSVIGAGREDEMLDKAFVGVAPRSRIISVKVASYSGATDVSQVLAAIDWVVQHRNTDGLNIRVLNLSFGTDATQSYLVDPLTYAAEVAWRSGIVVVVAAGNSNFGSNRLNNPAHDPFVIAVGADDTMGTIDHKDDVVPAWSARGTATRSPDLVAPGSAIVSLRTGQSMLDQMHTGARIGTSRFFKGSGTSQAAAVVSGAAALLLSQRPGLSPDQVKYLLRSTAVRLPNTDAQGQGAGLINLKAAKDATTPLAGLATQLFPPGLGTGSLELARGTVHVVDGDVALTGEQDIFGASFDSALWATSAQQLATWSGGSWNGNTWTGNTWSGNTWSGNTWSGNTWSGNTWSGNTWSGNTWTGNTWTGNTWTGNTWSADGWQADAWQGATWH